MQFAQTVVKAAKLSGDLGIRTLDLQADIAALAERVTEQADTVERIGDDADRWQAILSDPANHLHLYGKHEARPGRKMGHVTRLTL